MTYDNWKTSPPEEEEKECPVCGSTEWDVFFKNRITGKIVGCDDCIKEVDAYDLHLEDQARKEAAEDMKLDESRGK